MWTAYRYPGDQEKAGEACGDGLSRLCEENVMFKVLSYGAGVQTFGLLCMIKQGQIEKPDLIIFADTQNESPETYYHMNVYAKPLAYQLGIDFIEITKGSIINHHLENGHTMTPPICSKTFKGRIIEQRVKRYAHYLETKIEMWIGISIDEEERAGRKSETSWVENRYPLVEMDLSRDEVKQIILDAGEIIPPKSGCEACCWKGTNYWLAMKANKPKKLELYQQLEQGGHKLPMYGPSLTQISQQTVMLFEWEGTESHCATGICNA